MSRPWQQTVVAIMPTASGLAFIVMAVAMLPRHMVAFVSIGTFVALVNAAVVLAWHPILADMPTPSTVDEPKDDAP